jgi:hypothetical protein
MKLFAMIAGICLLSQPAVAGMRECKTIPDSGARLACYDKAAAMPAASVGKPVPAKPLIPTPARTSAEKTDPAKYVDTIGAEDARMNAQLKNICRGC